MRRRFRQRLQPLDGVVLVELVAELRLVKLVRAAGLRQARIRGEVEHRIDAGDARDLVWVFRRPVVDLSLIHI